MKVLGIETSCDETGIAVYDSDCGLIGEGLYSQVQIHARFGGVIPELASRDHIRKTLPLIKQVLGESGLSKTDLDGIAYTAGPGLVGALLVGASVGRALAMGLEIPAIGVHHMEGHLLAPMLESDPPDFPFVALLVSGGHTQLVKVDGIGQYEVLGESLDDAAGEAFDKVGKMLGLPYPGGPNVARLATRGVGANAQLREVLDSTVAKLQGSVFYAEPKYCTDNDAMIAYAGCRRLMAGERNDLGIEVRPRWSLESLSAI